MQKLHFNVQNPCTELQECIVYTHSYKIWPKLQYIVLLSFFLCVDSVSIFCDCNGHLFPRYHVGLLQPYVIWFHYSLSPVLVVVPVVSFFVVHCYNAVLFLLF